MKAPQGKIVISIVGDDDGEMKGLHLLRFDGANAPLLLPAEFGADIKTVRAGLRDADYVAR